MIVWSGFIYKFIKYTQWSEILEFIWMNDFSIFWLPSFYLHIFDLECQHKINFVKCDRWQSPHLNRFYHYIDLIYKWFMIVLSAEHIIKFLLKIIRVITPKRISNPNLTIYYIKIINCSIYVFVSIVKFVKKNYEKGTNL